MLLVLLRPGVGEFTDCRDNDGIDCEDEDGGRCPGTVGKASRIGRT